MFKIPAIINHPLIPPQIDQYRCFDSKQFVLHQSVTKQFIEKILRMIHPAVHPSPTSKKFLFHANTYVCNLTLNLFKKNKVNGKIRNGQWCSLTLFCYRLQNVFCIIQLNIQNYPFTKKYFNLD